MSMYIYDMPYGKYLDLQRILDINQQWKELAKQIGTFKSETIDYIALDALKPGQSPTNTLLTIWGQSNATVKELFRHLKAMNNKRALGVLRGIVPDEYFHENRNLKSEKNDMKLNLDTSELPSCPESCIQNGQGVVIKSSISPTGTPLPPYQSENSWQNDPARQPTQSECSVTSLSEQFESQGKNQVKVNQCNSMTSSGSLHDMAKIIIPKFTPDELWSATDGFSPRNEIGHGAFGTVYLGNLKRLRQKVAIKLLNKEDKHELEALFRCRHANIIQLLGYCQSETIHCLVYDYMTNGSLLDTLMCTGGRPPLTWKQRLNILNGAAKAIHYLHSLETPIIHGDIKSANILLDKHFEAKVADFGLAKQMNGGQYTKFTHVSQRNEKVYGSMDYLPDEYLEDVSKLRKEVDMFSFGIVIFETCLGVKACDATRISNGQFKKLKDLINAYRDVSDGDILESKMKDWRCLDWPTDNWLSVLRIGFQCTISRWRKRPSMDQVIDALEFAAKVAEEMIQKQDSAHSMASSSCHQHISFSSYIKQPENLENDNHLKLGTDDRERETNVSTNDSEEMTLVMSKGKVKLSTLKKQSSDIDLEKVGETGKLMMIQEKISKFEGLNQDPKKASGRADEMLDQLETKLAADIIKSNLENTSEPWILAKIYDNSHNKETSSGDDQTSGSQKDCYEYLCDTSSVAGMTGKLNSITLADQLSTQKAESNLYVNPSSWKQPATPDAIDPSSPMLFDQPWRGNYQGGGHSQQLLYLRKSSDEDTIDKNPINPSTDKTLSYHEGTGVLYCPKADSDDTSDGLSTASEEILDKQRKKPLPPVVQNFRMQTNSNVSSDVAEVGSNEESLGSYEINLKKKKQLHPLIQKYRMDVDRSGECSNQQLPTERQPQSVSVARQTEPVEHSQSLTGSENSDYDGSSFQGQSTELCISEPQSELLYSQEKPFSVVTSGTPPTASRMSPPVYQLAKH